ncbi:MAG: hypothetical protein AABX83_02585 [Nanoarchaeota archaeon]
MDARREFERNLYISNGHLMSEYNKSVIEYLIENKIPIKISNRDGDFIPYLETRSGFFKGFEDIKRYSIAILEIRAQEGFDREPMGGKILDSRNVMHFDKVSVQCAPPSLIEAVLERQK